jgi:hypothetical protein
MDRQNDRQRNEYNCCAWAGGTFFPVVLLCQFFGSGEKLVLVLHTYVLRVQYSCGIVLVFWFWPEIVFNVTYYTYLVLSVQCSCAVVSVFLLWQEIVLKMRTPFDIL